MTIEPRLTIAMAARRLGLTTQRVYQLIDSGKLIAEPAGRFLTVLESDVEERIAKVAEYRAEQAAVQQTEKA